MDHEILEAWIFGFDRPDAVDDLARCAAEPGFLLHAVADRGNLGGSARRAPGAAVLVGITHEAKRREPLVAFVMRRLDALDRLFLAGGEIEAGAPDHVLAELLGPAMAGTGLV